MKRSRILKILDNYDSISLELAATADFLSKNGFQKDPWKETTSRKDDKATADRVSKAKLLLADLRKLR